jgi:hypothetical protein
LSSTADATVRFLDQLYWREEDIDTESLSLFVAIAMYQAALMQRRLWKDTFDCRHKYSFETMKSILQQHGKRWKTAGIHAKDHTVPLE